MNENSLVLLSKANQMLAECKTIDEAKDLMDIASAAKHYAQKHKLGKEAVNHAREIEIRAEILLGEFLKQMEKNKGTLKVGNAVVTPGYHGKIPTLAEIGVTKKESSESQRLANLPESEKEKVILGKIPKKNAIRKNKETETREAKIAQPLPKDLYQILLADPPWEYEHSVSDSRKIENQYPTMSLEIICNLKIPAAPDSLLFLWATNPKLEEAFSVINAWGFSYRTNLVWIKDKIGMGYYFRQQHELLLVAKKGNFPTPAPETRVSSVLNSPRLNHSQKPDTVYEIIEAMYPEAKKLELFSRAKREKWARWGNELL